MAKAYATSKTIEHTDTLPMTINANGSALADYRVYGSDGGVGDRTENLFDGSISQGGWGAVDGSVVTRQNEPTYKFYAIRLGVDDPIPLNQLKSYTFRAFPSNIQVTIKLADENNIQISDTGWNYTHTISNCQRAIVTLRKSDNSRISPNDILGFVIIEGSTAPAEYVPYGYGLSLSVTSPKSYTCEVNSLQASTNYAKIAVAELPTVKVGDKVTVTVGGTDYTLPVKNVDSSYVYIENMEV